jgi:Second Messenger Oligonucleotide or Dinucleotide Synthetase domain
MNISARFDRFIANIRPTREQREDADRQAAILKERLIAYVANDNQFHLQKIFRSGSTAKHTDLGRTGEGTFDIDLGVYYRAEGRTKEELDKLLSYTYTCLREIYPEKPAHDFYLGKNAVTVTFRTSKLRIDVVPIVRDGSLKRRNSGKIPRQDEWRLTSITAHIHFIHARTARSKSRSRPVKFNHLVRLMKWWNRRLPEHLKQCSYFCEVITAAALENEGVAETWQGSLERIFAFLHQHAFACPIIFGNYDDAKSVNHPKGLVVVLDAVNPKNNVTHKWDETIKRGFLEQVGATYKAIKQAQKAEQRGNEEEALNAWCNVFGDDFRRLS